MSKKEDLLFEYKILICDPHENYYSQHKSDFSFTEEEKLNDLGLDGWELVKVIELDIYNVNNKPKTHHKYIFKRRIFPK